MDRQTYDIINAVIDLDCQATGDYRRDSGNMCILGGLYAVLDPDWAVGGIAFKIISAEIEEAYGLTSNTIAKFIGINDSALVRAERQANLHAFLDTLLEDDHE